MRKLFTAAGSGRTKHELDWGVRTGRWRRVQQNVYAEGPDPLLPVDHERARVLAGSSAARGGLAGVLHRLDSVELDGRPVRRGSLPPERIVVIDGIRCANGLQTLVDLSASLDDDTWEQALESALRKRLLRLEDLCAVGPRVSGGKRVRRVLARRGDVPPTESLLETLMAQLIRRTGLPDPVRQLVVTTRHGTFVARVDLCWPDLGIFLELDGQGHENQPVYDAHRQTSVVTATGWLVGRYTWREVVHTPRSTERRVAELHALRSAA